MVSRYMGLMFFIIPCHPEKMGKKHPVKNLENDQMDINRLITPKTVVSSIFWPWHMWEYTTHVRYEPRDVMEIRGMWTVTLM